MHIIMNEQIIVQYILIYTTQTPKIISKDVKKHANPRDNPDQGKGIGSPAPPPPHISLDTYF